MSCRSCRATTSRGLREGLSSGVTSTTLFVCSTCGLALGIVGVAVDALSKSFLTDVEGQRKGVGGAVRHGAVGADTAVGERSRVACVYRSSSSADLRASVQLSMAPGEGSA